ncbi:MAG: GNAT family N-acetyltransferase [Silicimonas sp.]|nr:GNAT family N-acetyltransferase [Silicimonas sp.]
MDGVIFQTERLVLRSLEAMRGALVAALPRLLTPEVLAPLPPSLAFPPGADPAAWVAARAAEAEVLVVMERAEDAVIGLVLLARHGGDVVHLGYLLGSDAWGRGLASEMLGGLVAWFEAQGPVTLVGGVVRGNLASGRVLEKAGFWAEDSATDGEMRLYRREID